jgi:hypothetical protein
MENTKNEKQCAIHDVMRSCFNCRNLHSFQGDGDVVCNTYCSERYEIDYIFTNKKIIL